MNVFEQRMIDNLDYSEQVGNDDVMFPGYGYLVEGAYQAGILSDEWRQEFEAYCTEYPSGTDDFSYMELMVRIFNKYKPTNTLPK